MFRFCLRYGGAGLRKSFRMDHVFLDEFAPEKMTFDDLIQDFRAAGVVPDSIGVHDGDGPVDADPEATRFRTQHPAFGACESLLPEPFLQVFPCRDAGLTWAALRLGRFGAEKDMARGPADADDGGGAPGLGSFLRLQRVS